MIARRGPMRPIRSARAPRVGLWGLLGAGNLGNDGSLEAVLGHLRTAHPDAVLGALCSGPEQVQKRFGIPATRLHWYRREYETASGPAAILVKAVGKGLDAIRTALWVRRFDAVIVPGMGVLEASGLPLRPWGTPYSLFLLCASGRLLGTKVALVNVGADVIEDRATRWLVTAAARLAHYRSYRDDLSRDAMARMGVDTSRDRVRPDLVFALPTPAGDPRVPGTVGVGVMAYYGGNADRRQADEIHAAYVGKMARFVRWLVDEGHAVRLFVGAHEDCAVVRSILADVREHRPDAVASQVTAAPIAGLPELLRQMSAVDIVVATRYHNVLCALKLGKPTLSVGYAPKNDALLSAMGLDGCCQDARSLDVDRLIAQFTALTARRPEVERALVERNRENVRLLEQQFDELTAVLLPAAAAGLPRWRWRAALPATAVARR